MAALKSATKKDTGSTSAKIWGFLKYALPVAAAVGAIATCVLFPPAALFVAPAVEWLVANAIPAFASLYAGLISFSAITAGIAAAAAVTTRVLMAAAEAVVNACTDKDPAKKTTAAKAEPKAEPQPKADPQPQPQPQDQKVHRSPVSSAVPAPQSAAETLTPGM